MKVLPSLLVLACFFPLSPLLRAELTDEQKHMPLEIEAPDSSFAKIVIIAGGKSAGSHPGGHEYFAGCSLLASCLKQTPGVWPVLVAEGWPANEAIFKGARAIVIYADGGAKLSILPPERWTKMRQLIEGGVGVVMLHQSIDIPEDHAEEFQSWVGGAWTKDIGVRGHWGMAFSDFPKHACFNGVEPFSIANDGWLYNLHFAENVVPLLTGVVPDKTRSTPDAKEHVGRAESVAWAYERPQGGRSVVFTGAHEHQSWGIESQRKFVVNSILWSAHLKVPDQGAPVDMASEVLLLNLDEKPKAPSKPEVK